MEEEIINRIRTFNRFYVRVLGVLDSSIMHSGYSLTEAHILNVIHNKPGSTATKINEDLHLDEGYLSRTIKKLEGKKLIRREQSETDKRKYIMSLTARGKEEYAKIDELSSNQVKDTLKHISANEKLELAELMERIKALISS